MRPGIGCLKSSVVDGVTVYIGDNWIHFNCKIIQWSGRVHRVQKNPKESSSRILYYKFNDMYSLLW